MVFDRFRRGVVSFLGGVCHSEVFLNEIVALRYGWTVSHQKEQEREDHMANGFYLDGGFGNDGFTGDFPID